jgi:hypothetical protein
MKKIHYFLSKIFLARSSIFHMDTPSFSIEHSKLNAKVCSTLLNHTHKTEISNKNITWICDHIQNDHIWKPWTFTFIYTAQQVCVWSHLRLLSGSQKSFFFFPLFLLVCRRRSQISLSFSYCTKKNYILCPHFSSIWALKHLQRFFSWAPKNFLFRNFLNWVMLKFCSV